MNATTIAPEVRDFLTAVRAQLADLDPEEQRDILDGLEADLTDLVAERGGEALGDPVAYARELRTAAGLDPDMGRPQRRTSVSEGVHSFLDDAHRQFDRMAAALPGDAAAVIASLQPAWWVLRAWIAVEVAAYLLGEWALQVIPGSNVPGAIALLAAVVLSVQLGRGKLWPGDRWRTAAGLRVLLLGLNVFAVVMVGPVAEGLQHGDYMQADGAYEAGYRNAQAQARQETAGLSLGGKPIRNIYPYDAAGHPLTGVQLVDSSGHPMTLTNDPYDEGTGWGDLMLTPWLNGKTEQFNVFPLAEQRLDESTQEPVGIPAIQAPPFASLPPVSLAGVEPSTLQAAN
jgi:hypothetical protein